MIAKIEFFKWYVYAENGIKQYQYYIPYNSGEDGLCYFMFHIESMNSKSLKWNINYTVEQDGEIDYKKMGDSESISETSFVPQNGWEKEAIKILFKNMSL